MNKKPHQTEKRILARRLARPLNEEEMRIANGAHGVVLKTLMDKIKEFYPVDTWSGTGSPESDCDS